ncbi:hypothetical protein GEV33_008446 [Tenebrio molitor]|uniref:Uncharacterized protein n=1 Tax=Tenebrio molitor TaxID=7067 RepID=A0A8J6HHS5_TENMO|nr:hypothetical protein GEV33_008446 [Tenebrio molitor]
MRLHTLVFLLILFTLVYSASCQFSFGNLLDKISNLTSSNDLETARKKKKKGNKYTVPLLFGALMVKSIMFPLAFKAMAIMSSIAVVLSTMSLIISSIVGYVKLAVRSSAPSVKVIHKPYNSWAKDDDNSVKNYYAPAENSDWMAPPPQ